MQLPSNRVGFVLIFVVLAVASTIFFTRISGEKPVAEPESVSLVLARNTDGANAAGDADGDGLLDWQEELYGSSRTLADTDGDGTEDGDEIALRRDPSVAGPDDPLMTSADYFTTEVDLKNFATGTVTDKLSVDLFAQYLNLKKNDQLTPEAETKLVEDLTSQAVQNADYKAAYDLSMLRTVPSNKESVRAYGEEFARISIRYLQKMDSYKTLPDDRYIPTLGAIYPEFAQELADMDVPTVAQDVHLQLINRIRYTGTVMNLISKADSDPVSAIVAIGKQQTFVNDFDLYTSLAQYFKNNGIIFTDTPTIRFWNYFES